MRSLYWLTAITLVAAAVTTVAIADYGRRHPNSLPAMFSGNGNASPIQAAEVNYYQGQGKLTCEKVECGSTTRGQATLPPPPALPRPVTSPILPTETPLSPALVLESCEVPGVGTVTRVVSDPYGPAVVPPQIPKPACPQPVRIEEVPEHQMLREAALKNLASVQQEVPNLELPQLPPSTQKPEVVDEFSFNDKPLQPLYVPIEPKAGVVLPPSNVMKEVAKLPWIPGVSQSTAAVDKAIPTPSFKQVPAYIPETVRGPEVLPGLHAARPATKDDDNPVQETMQAIGELISLMSPTTYLYNMPLDKKVSKPTAFAETKVAVCDDKCATCPATKPDCCKVGAECCKAGAACCEVAATCQADGTCCKADGTCCKNATTVAKTTCCQDEIVVRTYSVAEFTTSAGTNHDDLIRLITTMVAPESWQTKDSTIEFFPLGKCLVVRHSSKVQDQVDDLLTQLRGQVQKQNKNPIISRVPTMLPELSVDLELVPVTPRENSTGMPRVITNESNHCLGDDDFFGMIPMSPTGRLLAVPMTQPRVDASSLVPAGFAQKATESATFVDGPVLRTTPKAPEFFPWFLPYAPLPEGPVTCEEELLNRVGYVNYTDEEVAMLFLIGCECEEQE